MARKNLFQRLSQLFVGNRPIVKRRVRNYVNAPVNQAMSAFKQQQGYLYGSSLNQTSLYDRQAAMADFQEMDLDAIINSALNLYAEEVCSQDKNGNVLHIFSENKQIKNLLEFLFYETLNVNFFLTPWVRNLVKYGDLFLMHEIREEYGITNVYPLPVNEITREEGFDAEIPNKVRFRWLANANKIIEDYEMSHFRLLHNDAFLPYGSSVLSGARRIWRNLKMLEDAMLIYRIVRSPERRVFYIDTGNIPPESVENYMEQVKSSMRSDIIVNKTTGQVDKRFNALPVWKKTPIPLLDGRTISIEQLAQEYKLGKTNWVCSIKDETKEVVPGKVIWCGKNYRAKKMIKVFLDDGTWVMTAKEHPFILRDGKTKRADQLKPADSLMPLYIKLSSIKNGDKIDGYKMAYDIYDQKYKYLHNIVGNNILCEDRNRVAKNLDWTKNDSMVVHHIDFDKVNNDPLNLKWMGNKDHIKYHSQLMEQRWNDPVQRQKLIESFKRQRQEFWNDPTKEKEQQIRRDEFKERIGWYNNSDLHTEHNEIRKEAQEKSWTEDKHGRSVAMRWKFTEATLKIFKYIIKTNHNLSRDNFIKEIRRNKDFIEQIKKDNPNLLRNPKTISKPTLIQSLRGFGYKDFSDFKHQIINNNDVIYREHIDKSWFVSKECLDIIANLIKENKNISQEKLIFLLRENILFKNKLSEDNKGFYEQPDKFSKRSFSYNLKRNGYENYSYFKNSILNEKYIFGKNHKVKKVVEVEFEDDVYCMTVVGPNGEEDRHNFACNTFDKNLNVVSSGIYLGNSVLQDYYLPTRSGETATKIESLSGGKHASDIDDVNYLLSQLFAALNIPKAFLQYDEALSSKATLAYEDVRFANNINNIQKAVLSELNKIAIIHLMAHGFEDDELLDFELKLSNPSTLAEQQKLELMRAKFEIMSTPNEGLFSRDWLRKNVMNLTDEEIVQIDKEIAEDRLFETKLEADFGEGGGGGGGSLGGPTGGGLGGEIGGEELGGSEDELGNLGGGSIGTGIGGGEELGTEPGEELPPEGEEEEEEQEADNNLDGEERVLLGGDENQDDIVLSEIDEEDEDEEELKEKRRDWKNDTMKLSIKDDDAPVKALSQMQKTIYNRRRKRRHGPGTTHMPNFSKMLSPNNKSFSDPFDKEHVLGNPFKDHIELDSKKVLDIYLSRKISENEKLTSQTLSMLKNFKNKLASNKNQLLKEDQDLENILEESLEPEVPDQNLEYLTEEPKEEENKNG